MLRMTFLAALAVAACTSSPPGGARGAQEKPEGAAAASPEWGEASHDELARFVAGLETGSPEFAGLEQQAGWVEYRRAIDPRWARLEARQLEPMRRWAARELPPQPGRPQQVLYPFSGPDLVNVTTSLPGRRGAILLSLEPVGEIPDFQGFDEASFDAFFAGLEQALASTLAWNFFQTRQLRRDLTAPGLRGVLPVLLFFAARDGQRVLDVRYLFVSPDAALEERPALPGPAPAGTGVPGVRLLLKANGDAEPFELDYFCIDLSSASLDQHRGFFASIARRGPFTTYLKAASYLMFKAKYSGIERFILDHSREVLQDDSGIPFARFAELGWQVKLYGSYERPIPLFEHRYQADLAAAYSAAGDLPPLPFSVGYQTRPGRSTLMLAVRPAP